LIVTAILDKVLPRSNMVVYSLGMVAANLIIIGITLQILRSRTPTERKRVAEPQPVATPERSLAGVQPVPPAQPPVSSSSTTS
jgi:hypothetical protein